MVKQHKCCRRDPMLEGSGHWEEIEPYKRHPGVALCGCCKVLFKPGQVGHYWKGKLKRRKTDTRKAYNMWFCETCTLDRRW